MKRSDASPADRRLAMLLMAPALVIVLGVTMAPVAATAWEAIHLHDLRLPWLGMPFVGLANFGDAFTDPRFGAAILRTSIFAGISVPIELALGLAFAMVMHRIPVARGLARVTTLLPFAIPTVVAALIWRFLMESVDQGTAGGWLTGSTSAWVPIVLADVWKTTPFVALLLLAGLQGIDEELYDAARMDGARPMRQLATITLPLLAPAIVVAAAFRTLDALRLFDLPYVLTGGGPGTATEPVSLYAFIVLMQRLQFGYGSALSLLVFAFALLVALVSVRVLDRISVHGRAS